MNSQHKSHFLAPPRYKCHIIFAIPFRMTETLVLFHLILLIFDRFRRIMLIVAQSNLVSPLAMPGDSLGFPSAEIGFPMMADCLHASQIDCTCFCHQPCIPVFHLNSREIVDLCTPTKSTVCVCKNPTFFKPEIWNLCSLVSCV